MPWTAPGVMRPEVPRVADERTMLEAWLDWHRQTLLVEPREHRSASLQTSLFFPRINCEWQGKNHRIRCKYPRIPCK